MGTFDIRQTNYNIHSKLNFLLILKSYKKYNTQAKEKLTKVKRKWSGIQFDVFDLSFIFFNAMS